jgi:hypothetical protein
VSAQPQKIERKTYSVPVLRCYGSVVATTLGGSGPDNDGGGVKAKA